MKFGLLKAIRIDGKMGAHNAWLCECECGSFVRVRGNYLMSSLGKRLHCGCLAENLKAIREHARYGHLVVIGQDGRYKNGPMKLLCQCDCGNLTTLPHHSLKTGKVQSCGCPEYKNVPTTRERFEKYIEMIPESGCWIWMGNCNIGGYGQFSLGGHPISAHRYSWLIHKGDIPSELNVLHRCDVRPCVNPHHLFLGTTRDNAEDCGKKGRLAAAKLTVIQVKQIRSDLRSCKDIAPDYGVTDHAIREIKHGKTWMFISPHD